MPTHKPKQRFPVKKLREAAGLTQAEFAHRLGVSVITVSRWEREKAYPLPVFEKELAKLADVFPGDHPLPFESRE